MSSPIPVRRRPVVVARSRRGFLHRLPHLKGRELERQRWRKTLKDQKFDVERSIRYHSRRQAFFETFDTVVNTTNLILGSGAVLALIDKRLPPSVLLALTAVVAAISFVNLSVRSAQKSALHSQFRQRYFDLLKKVGRIDPDAEDAKEQIAACRDLRFDIERDEPPTYCMVDVLAHNEQARAQGETEDQIWVIPPFKALTANIWRYETNDLKRLSQSSKQ